jgi:hypothetical protein
VRAPVCRYRTRLLDVTLRDDEWPELCHCRDRAPWGTKSHTNCRSSGPYCPACAPKVEARLMEIREAYRDW